MTNPEMRWPARARAIATRTRRVYVYKLYRQIFTGILGYVYDHTLSHNGEKIFRKFQKTY